MQETHKAQACSLPVQVTPGAERGLIGLCQPEQEEFAERVKERLSVRGQWITWRTARRTIGKHPITGQAILSVDPGLEHRPPPPIVAH
jgi:hypothetical protein